MAISRVTTWSSGQTLTATALNGEFNNILDNPVSLWSPAATAADMNGFELILDADADTSITADTDDQIDIRLSAADDFRFTANVFTSLAGSKILTSQSSDIASAATVDLATATGNTVDVTGTVTITALGTVQEGAVFVLQFDGALTLTYNATSLKLPGNANITTAAGDIAIVVSEGAGNWRCAAYMVRANAPGGASLAANTFTGVQRWAASGDIASAATTDLNTATGNYVSITGAVTITAFGTVSAGTVIVLRFASALTLTHNATSLILPNNGSNITTATNDTAIMVSLGSGNWRCAAYQRASGQPVATAAGITLGTEVASTSGTSIDFTSIPAGVRKITIMLVGVSTNGTSNLLIQIGDVGGIEVTGYSSGASNAAGSVSATSTAGFLFTVNNAAADVASGPLTLYLEDSTGFTWVFGGEVFLDPNPLNHGYGSKSLSAELDRVRVTTVNGTDAFDAGAINIQYQS